MGTSINQIGVGVIVSILWVIKKKPSREICEGLSWMSTSYLSWSWELKFLASDHLTQISLLFPEIRILKCSSLHQVLCTEGNMLIAIL